jgi:hypothetical protein
VDVAEQVTDTHAVKSDGVRRACFVQAEIESLAIKQRKDVVKERVAVRKIDYGADVNDGQMRLEAFVLLNDLRPFCWLLNRREHLGCRSIEWL